MCLFTSIAPPPRLTVWKYVVTISTVTRDVEPYSIVGGNPARFIRKRFSDKLIGLLAQVQWWNWDEQKLFAHLELLVSGCDEEKLYKLLEE